MTTALRIELVYDRDCPNVAECREALRQALRELGAPAWWQEWEVHGRSTPDAYRRLGSPTVLLDGRDVCSSGRGDTAAESCRLYDDPERGCLCGAPSVATLRAALRQREVACSR